MGTYTYTVKQILYEMIPQDIMDELMGIGESIKRNCVRIGLIANALCATVDSDPKLGIGRMEVYDVVAEMLNQEVSARTVRYYAGVMGFYKSSVPPQYLDLPFSHLAFASAFELDWETILDHSIEVAENYGKPPSVSSLSSWFIGSRMVDNGGKYYPPEPDSATDFEPGLSSSMPDQQFTSSTSEIDNSTYSQDSSSFPNLIARVIRALRQIENMDDDLLAELRELRELLDRIMV